jgi:hypothetical protein
MGPRSQRTDRSTDSRTAAAPPLQGHVSASRRFPIASSRWRTSMRRALPAIQASAETDQLASDRDQAASDRELAADGTDPQLHDASRDIRQAHDSPSVSRAPGRVWRPLPTATGLRRIGMPPRARAIGRPTLVMSHWQNSNRTPMRWGSPTMRSSVVLTRYGSGGGSADVSPSSAGGCHGPPSRSPRPRARRSGAPARA